MASSDGRRVLPFVRNLGVLAERIGRARVAHVPRARREQALVAGAVLAAALILLFVLTIDGHSPGWPREVSRTLRHVFQGVTRFGRSDWLLVPTGVFCLALLAADWERVNRRVAAAWAELGSLVAFFFIAVAAAGMTGNLIKWVFGRSRPVLDRTDGPFTLTPFSFEYANVSFPSGHATTAAAAATALVLIFRGRPAIKVAAVTFALTIAASRVMVRAHYPSDVVAGLFVGVAVTLVCAAAFARRRIAFNAQADGTFVPRTVALRRSWEARAGREAARASLAVAWSGALRR